MRKIGLVGCGTIGRLHAGNLCSKADLFFCSRSPSSAEKFQKKFGGKGVFTRFEDLLSHTGIEAVVIASPPAFHREQLVATLEAGKSVLVEKPMCVAPEELAVIEAAVERQRDQFLMVAENYCYKPALANLQELLGRGAIGRVHSVAVKKLCRQQATGWKHQYGALLEGGIHFIAFISALLGTSPQRVTAEFPGLCPGEPERHSTTRLEYPDGVQAELQYAWDVPSLARGLFQHSRITGSRGCLVFESNGLYIWLRSGLKWKLYLPGFTDLMGYGRMIQDFLACLEDPLRKPQSDFYRARRDLEIVFAAYGQGGNPVQGSRP